MDASPGAIVQVRRLPGGARVVELWIGSDRFGVTASGELDALDQHAVVDLITGGILRGARHVRVDARNVTFVDAAVFRSLAHCRRFLARVGGSLTVVGLRAPFDLAWDLVDTGAVVRDELVCA